jgi:hypothetical protein
MVDMAGPENVQGICIPSAMVAEFPQVLASRGAKVDVVAQSDAERAAAWKHSAFRCTSPDGPVVLVTVQHHKTACGEGSLVLFYPQWEGRGEPEEKQFLADLVETVRLRGAYEMARQPRAKRA